MTDLASQALSNPSAEPVGVGPLAYAVLRVFFRQVEVIGAERVPCKGPLMVVANHVNGLIDPAVLLGFLPRRPRLLGKSTLWGNPLVRFFLQLAAAIPVFRRQDPGVDPTKNTETFQACYDVLRTGGVIAIFPEGKSHNEPAIEPLKTGVARIVLEAEAGSRSGPIGSRILPVGLTFDDKGRFRSRVLVHIGEPIDPAADLERYREDAWPAVEALTEKVRAALEAVTLNFPSWEEARLIERAAAVFGRPSAELPAESTLSDSFALHRTFIEGYRDLRERYGAEVDRVAAAVRDYDERLATYGLRDSQVASVYPRSKVQLFVLKSLVLLVIRLPAALVGILLNFLPYWLIGRIARRLGTSPDLPATYKVFGSLVFYPITWIAWAVAAGVSGGIPLAFGVLLLGPVSGIFALRNHERRRYFQGQARAYLLLRSGDPGIEDLRRRRDEVLRAVERLAAVYQEASEATASGVTEPASTRSPWSDVQ